MLNYTSHHEDGEVEALTSTLYGAEWPVSCSGQSQYGHCGEEEDLLSYPGIKP
jgi:hypothetical protein